MSNTPVQSKNQKPVKLIDELSPHARASLERILGKPKDFKKL